MDARKTGELIARLRRERGWSQTELAERIGVTNKAVSRWETGRGYPDVELLPRIAQTLDISISELLEGESAQPEVLPQRMEQQILRLCENAGREKRRTKQWMAVLAAVLALILGFELYHRFAAFAETIIGSPCCVIAADYSSLSYYGQRYVPLPLEGAACGDMQREIVDEARVEGTGFWGKLFFGESLYAIHDDAELDIVYLDSDYDSLISHYYVRESEYEEYESLLENARYDVYRGVIWQEDDTTASFRLDEETVELLREAEEGTPLELGSWGQTEWRIDVRAYEAEGLFYREYGEIIAAGDAFYWSPCEYSEMTGTVLCWRYYRVQGELFPGE